MMIEQTPKVFTFITRHAPYGRDNAFACLDMVLACAAFDQKINYLFIEDGVFQLLKNQQASSIEHKSFSAPLAALDIYGVNNIYVDETSLMSRGLTSDDLAIEVLLISAKASSQLVSASDVVFSL